VISLLPDRIRARINLTPCKVPDLHGPCWEWTGSDNGNGYGRPRVDGKNQLVHRYAYTVLVGPIPPGLQIDHLCRNRRCCNPDHLEPVTNLENSLRSDRATRTHCARGHPLSGDNLILKKPGERGRRRCRACFEAAQARATAKRHRARHLEAAS
jgi:hypothetical protein